MENPALLLESSGACIKPKLTEVDAFLFTLQASRQASGIPGLAPTDEK